MKVKELFKFPIERKIESVVKVNDEDAEKVRQEMEEYVVTNALEIHYDNILEKILDSKEQPTRDIGVWLSGFFGSGKSLFMKNLSYILEGKKIGSKTASEIFLTKLENSMTKANLSTINGSMKIRPILFEIKSQEDQMNPDSIVEILYRQFNKSFGFSEQVWIAELEKELIDANKYEEFKNEIKKETNMEWIDFRTKTLRLKPVLYKTLKNIYPGVYDTDEKIKESIASFEKISLTPEKFAEKIKEFVDKNLSAKEKLIFFIDEMGMFVGDNSEKLLELQSIVENVGVKSNGKIWIVVTAQEKLDEVIEGVKRKKVEFAKISDRFNMRITLTSENIDMVVKERILKKKDSAIKELTDKYHKIAGKINNDINFRDWARAKLIPKLDDKSFVETYPFLPYQLKVIPEIFNNIRSKGAGYTKLSGRERSMLGAVHTVFKEPINFKDRKVGDFVTFDMIYDVISVELDGDTKKVINETVNLDDQEGEFINRTLKSLFLMQQLTYIPRTLSNVAMFMYEDINIDLKTLKDRVEKALNKLSDAQYVIKDHTGWKFLSPDEKKVEEEIQSMIVKPYEKQQAARKILESVFDVGKVNYKGISVFDIKLNLDGELRSRKGEVEFKVLSSINQQLEDKTNEQVVSESLDNAETVFWLADDIIGLNDRIEKFERLRKVLDKKSQEKRNGGLSEEEKDILNEKQKEMDNLKLQISQDLKKSFYTGTIIYDGKEKKLDGKKQDLPGLFKEEIERIIPKVYHSFSLADVKAAEGDILDIFEKKLTGIAPVYKSLGLVDDNNNIQLNSSVAQEVLTTIKNKCNFGQPTLGKDLIEHFSKRPYGWNPVIIRIVLATLFRNGTLLAQFQQRVFQDFTEIGAKDLFRVANSFKNTKFEEAGEGDLTPEQRTSCRSFVDEIFDERVGDTIDALNKIIKSKASDLKAKTERVQGIISSYGLPYDNKFAVVKRTVTRIEDQVTPTKIIQVFLEHATELKDTVPLLLKIDNFGTEAQLKEFRRIKQFTENILVRFNQDAYEEFSKKILSESLIDDWNQIRGEYEKQFGEFKKDYDAALKERAQSFKELKTEIESHELFKGLNDSEKEDIVSSVERKTTSEQLPENTTTFNVGGESLEQVKENINGLNSFKQQAIRKMVVAMQSKKEKAEADKLVFMNIGGLVSGTKIENDKDLSKTLDKIKSAVEKELKQGKKVMLG